MVALAGLTAISARRIGDLRPDPPELRARRTIVVLSGADSGAGTLREAIFAANRSDDRVRIIVQPTQVELRASLPPIVNARGVVLESAAGAEIDARSVTSGTVLEIAAPSTTMSGISIRGARDTAIAVIARSFLAREVVVRESGDGIALLSGSDGAVIEQSRFESNVVGIRVAVEVIGTIVRDSVFAEHDDAGVWAAGGAPIPSGTHRIALLGNRFSGDRIGIAAINVPARIEDNVISDDGSSGIYLFGSGSLVRSNRITDGATGIIADRTAATMIESNEIARESNVGIMVRSSGGTTVRWNRIYSNSFGLAVVFGDRPSRDLLEGNLVTSNRYDGLYLIGASPLVRENRLLSNGAAPARLLEWAPWDGPSIPSQPRFAGNVHEANGIADMIRGIHRPPREGDSQ